MRTSSSEYYLGAETVAVPQADPISSKTSATFGA